MAIENLKELLESPGLMPKSESSRIMKIRKNRRLLMGDLLEVSDSDFSVNWLGRVVDFFPEFLFSETPEIAIESNPRMQDFLDELSDSLLAEFLAANSDMLAFGSGILATHPRDPFSFCRFDPDLHFSICDLAGDIVGDALIRLRGTPPDQKADVYHYPLDGGATWSIYGYAGASLGEQLGQVEIPDRKGRQVAVLDSGEGSIFDSTKQAAGELSKILSNLGEAVENNSKPHMTGSDGLLVEDENGNVSINKKGQFLPVGEGETPPSYLIYDSPAEAAQFLYSQHEKNLLAFAGLSTLLFDPSSAANNLSGRALARLILPTIAKLGFYSRVNSRAIKEAIRITNQNLQNAGQPYFSYRNSDLNVVWNYGDIFEDVNVREDRDQKDNEGE